jgi:Tol biopolymer transport system component
VVSDRRSDLNEPSWSPHGGRVAVTKSGHDERELALLHLPDGRLAPLEEEEEEETGGEEEVEVELPNHPAFSPDGRTIAFDAETDRERTALFLFEVESEELHFVESESDHYAYPAFSPNGRRLVFSRADAAFTWDLCIAELDGSDQHCITRGPASDTEPTWSPDGRSIVFASDRDDPKVALRSTSSTSTEAGYDGSRMASTTERPPSRRMGQRSRSCGARSCRLSDRTRA